MQLLYVDDDRINLMLFEHACGGVEGLSLLTASNGSEAVELARDKPIDLLVIDLHLPDTDGHALLRALRTEGANATAVLCSADDSAAVRQDAEAAGFARCWRKPVDARMLRDELALLRLPAALPMAGVDARP
jgi:CheY-like chemotaxis protein